MKKIIASSLIALLTLLPSAQLWANSAGETITYFHSDHLGSPIAATDETGRVKWIREYSAFGQDNNNGEQERIGWAGHEYLAESDLSYMGARWYNPELGRFMSPDPVMFVTSNSLSFNRYLYANNSPYTFYDPDGEFFDIAIDLISVSIGIGSAIKNFSQGNIKEGLMDVGGVVIDGAAAAIPFVPGGVGIARNAARYADDVVAGAGDLLKAGSKACSFAAGTMVSTPNGLEAIESLKPGDQILSQDENSGELTYKTISDAYSHVHENGMTLTIASSTGKQEVITTTAEHPFYVKGKGFVPAGELTVADTLQSASGDPITILDIDNTPLNLTAYNYAVADYHTYFVGESGVWVHNMCDVVKNVAQGSVKFGDDAARAADRLGFDPADVAIKNGIADIPIIFTSKFSPSDITKVTQALRSQGATSARINTGPIINDKITSRLQSAYESGKNFVGFSVTKTGNPENMFVLERAL
ncbi:MAG: polymorphic toxin-type HINT domain-containing protein [Reinekea sp.]